VISWSVFELLVSIIYHYLGLFQFLLMIVIFVSVFIDDGYPSVVIFCITVWYFLNGDVSNWRLVQDFGQLDDVVVSCIYFIEW
jgi:hypothetical protein